MSQHDTPQATNPQPPPPSNCGTPSNLRWPRNNVIYKNMYQKIYKKDTPNDLFCLSVSTCPEETRSVTKHIHAIILQLEDL